MRVRMLGLSLLAALTACAAAAQQTARTPNMTDIYCSGLITSDAVPSDTYLISGEQSNYKMEFAQGDLVYINRGSNQGAKVGDEFQVMRAERDPLRYKWFASQHTLLRAIGTLYVDKGTLRVVNVHPNVSIAEVVFSCDSMQRGDIVRPYTERPVPSLKADAKFDRFAPVSGKPMAMAVEMKTFTQSGGANSIVYINLGSAQGVKVGDYFRIFRYQGTRHESAPQTYGMAYRMYGYGSTPVRYHWDDLPREILGEGIVLRTAPNSSTVLITVSLREIYAGDYVEIE